jgi:hypothetical protein
VRRRSAETLNLSVVLLNAKKTNPASIQSNQSQRICSGDGSIYASTEALAVLSGGPSKLAVARWSRNERVWCVWWLRRNEQRENG